MVFPVVTYGCESWTIKKAESKKLMPSNFGAGEDSWNSLEQKGDQPVSLKGDQLWKLIGRTDAETEALVCWSSDANIQLTGKVPDAGKHWG